MILHQLPESSMQKELAMWLSRLVQAFCLLQLILLMSEVVDADEGLGIPWECHIIDDSSRGADGVRVADVNGDGMMDLATGWEEGGAIRICLHPGPQKSSLRWPSVEVGKVKSPEDAFWCDINGDGIFEVISCCEGRNRTVYLHDQIKPIGNILDKSQWRTSAFPETKDREQWMFGDSSDFDGDGQVEIVVSSKGANASISLLKKTGGADDGEQTWKLIRLGDAGWIMSLRVLDMDGDRDDDILISDRQGALRGIRWLENPGKDATKSWNNHFIGGRDKEVMFLDTVDINGDGLLDVVSASRHGHLLLYTGVQAGSFQQGITFSGRHEVFQPVPEGLPHGKAVRAGDMDGDGDIDLVHTSNTGSREAAHGRSGVHWLENPGHLDKPWRVNRVSDSNGRKFDRIELLDLDNDGDLDVITCEESDNLGLIWYENPAIRNDDKFNK